jgi:hypothetical protein
MSFVVFAVALVNCLKSTGGVVRRTLLVAPGVCGGVWFCDVSPLARRGAGCPEQQPRCVAHSALALYFDTPHHVILRRRN